MKNKQIRSRDDSANGRSGFKALKRPEIVEAISNSEKAEMPPTTLICECGDRNCNVGPFINAYRGY
jgi:hypothetical protein